MAPGRGSWQGSSGCCTSCAGSQAARAGACGRSTRGRAFAALRRLVKGLGVFDLRPPEGAHQAIALEAIADAVAAYEVVGRADIFELRTFILGHPHKEDVAPDGKGLPQARRPGERAVTTRETFDRDLERLKEDLLRMGDLVETAVRRSIEALQARSEAIADEVISGDDAADALHLELEERCMQLMATQQPMAKDLRMIAAVWAMTIDLERVGDHAEDIARYTKRIAKEPLLKPLIDIPRMSNLVVEMLHEGLDAFVARDAARAERMARRDDEVDHLYAQVFRELLTYMLEDPRNTQRATHLLMVAQALERVGDHATNIAERVIYMVTGTFKELNL